jgi:hypothetical protein
MGEEHVQKQVTSLRGKSHMPANSVFFEKVVPILLALMGLLTVGLVLFAAGVLMGLIKF